jgi:hypothetical protein
MGQACDTEEIDLPSHVQRSEQTSKHRQTTWKFLFPAFPSKTGTISLSQIPTASAEEKAQAELAAA